MPAPAVIQLIGGVISKLVQLLSRTVSAVGVAGTVTATYIVDSGGVVRDQTNATLETWQLAGLASDYDVRFTHTGGATPTGALNTWQNLSTNRSISLVVNTNGVFTSTLIVEIRRAAAPQDTLATASLTLQAERESGA